MVRSLYCTPETIILCATVFQKKILRKSPPNIRCYINVEKIKKIMETP